LDLAKFDFGSAEYTLLELSGIFLKIAILQIHAESIMRFLEKPGKIDRKLCS